MDNTLHFLHRPFLHSVLHLKGAKEVKGGKLKGAGSLGAFWRQITHDLLAQLSSHLGAGDATVKHSLDQLFTLA